MRKALLVALLALTGWQGALAQFAKTFEYGWCNHLSVGASVGTDGIGLDLATPLTSYGALRAGVSFFPKVKYSTTIDINDTNPSLTDEVDIEAKLNVFDVKVLADFYPSKKSSFHLTAGVFFGDKAWATASNTSMFIKDPAKYGKLGLKLGEQRITTDQQGYLHADVAVNKVKPYVGVGFGRAVPKKKRVTVTCDFGVQFWGKPRLGADTRDDWGNVVYHKFDYKELDEEYDDEDLRDGLKLAQKLTPYPVLNIRLTGRIF